MDYEKELRATPTNIPGLVVFDLPVRGDNRGWFKENWQRAKMTVGGLGPAGAGIPADFVPVQNNISYNLKAGSTRGIHAEPWDKFISIAFGSVFGAWVDLRPGASFGQVFTTVLDPSKAIFVPRGVGNSYQALEDDTVYTYLVNAHWSLEQKKSYTFVNLADPTLAIDWPIPLEQSERSAADLAHPLLKDAKPMAPRRTLVVGARGQLGLALRAYAEAQGLDDSFDYHDIDTFDIADPAAYDQFDWALYGTIINASGYTRVDEAETADGRKTAWRANVTGVRNLVQVALEHQLTLVHVSTDYVFDGLSANHPEGEAVSPLGVYAQTKVAADSLVSLVPKHYILRTSWVVGQGKNFVRTMQAMAGKAKQSGQPIAVVDDQYGRLTFAADIAEGIFHLLGLTGSGQPSSQVAAEPAGAQPQPAPYGTYNLTGSGRVASWREIAQTVFELSGADPELVQPVSTEDYFATEKAAGRVVSPRPAHSDLDLAKITAAGYRPRDWEESLRAYLEA